ncbi:MAG: glycosyltransferase family 2 protein [Bacteroidota bacterium]
MRKKVAVVILNWNGKKWLEKFLPDVIKNSSREICDVYVADNCSTDDSVEWLNTNFSEVKIIQNHNNNGYAGGYNEALKNVDADYFVLLNSDVEVSKNWLEPILEIFEKNKKIAACQPKILSYSEKNKFEYAGGAGGFIDRIGYPFCRGRIFDSIEVDKHQYEKEEEIFWASGCCLFIRSECLFEVGGLDTDFFAHMEEIDLCWRLKNKNYLIYYCPSSIVYHVGGGTLNAINPQKTYLNFRNNLYLLTKNLPSKFFFRTLLLRMILDGIAGIKFLLQGDINHLYAVLKAHKDFYYNFKKMYNKRKENNIDKKEKILSKVFNGSIVWNYYIKRNKTFTSLNKNNFY